MNLDLFHPDHLPDDHNFKTIDRFNSWTRLQPCRFLEWSGWYYSSVPLRLLGHYRLFQLYRKHHDRRKHDASPASGYILQARFALKIKYVIQLYGSFFRKIAGFPDRDLEMFLVNRILLTDRSDILHEFLTNADQDFETAFRHAIEQIQAPSFLRGSGTTLAAADAPRGKEKGVFSKKQILILFDLLAQTKALERFELHKPNKFEGYAQFLQALTGKSQETWIEELKNYQAKDLYKYHTPGECSQLVITLTNLSKTLRSGGLRSLAKLADKKIQEIELNLKD
ncbi:MAG TPA: hypothetical protein VI233_13905 [Puia sp.]